MHVSNKLRSFLQKLFPTVFKPKKSAIESNIVCILITKANIWCTQFFFNMSAIFVLFCYMYYNFLVQKNKGFDSLFVLFDTCFRYAFLHVSYVLFTCIFHIGCYKRSVYGSNCDIPCPANCKSNTCHIEHGTCFICKLGWTGPSCNLSIAFFV